MSYTKQTWSDYPSTETPVNADRLNHIEDGISNVSEVADSAMQKAKNAVPKDSTYDAMATQVTTNKNNIISLNETKVNKPQEADEGQVLTYRDDKWVAEDSQGEAIFKGTKATWNALSLAEREKYDGNQVIFTDDYNSVDYQKQIDEINDEVAKLPNFIFAESDFSFSANEMASNGINIGILTDGKITNTNLVKGVSLVTNIPDIIYYCFYNNNFVLLKTKSDSSKVNVHAKIIFIL